jgi:hypothetical protein
MDTRIDTVATMGGSDAYLLAAVGLPTLSGLGPVSGAVMTAHEYIELPTLAERTAVVAVLAHKLATCRRRLPPRLTPMRQERAARAQPRRLRDARPAQEDIDR